MRLIAGKMHDYYDSLLKYNSTEGNTFHRTDETVTLTVYNRYLNYKGVEETKDDNHILSALITPKHFGGKIEHKVNNSAICNFYSVSVLFCGKMYFGLRCDKTVFNGTFNYITTYIYNYNEFESYCNREQIELKHWSKEDGKRWRKPLLRVERLKDYFEPIDMLNFSIENKLVIAVVDGYYRTNVSCQPVYLNCELKPYEFYKVFDPYSAYQELSMYVDGQLAYPGNLTVEIEDKYKIAGKGFDPVYGFRTRPKDKK